MKLISDIWNLFIERIEFFTELIIQHLYISIIAIVIIIILGLSLGILMSLNKLLARVLLAIVNVFYTVPSIALFGILVAVTGIGNTSAIIALVVYGLLPVIKNTYVGITEVDADIIEAAKGMGATQAQLMWKVKLPLAMPVIFAGFRTSVIMTIALCGIASFIGAGGLGVAIWRGITTNFMEMTILGSVLVASLALVVDFLLSIVEKKVNGKIEGVVK